MNLLEQYKNLGSAIIINKHPMKDLYNIKYAHLGVDWNNPLFLLARGLILDENGNIIAKPYSKFFNWNELLNREDLTDKTKDLCKWEEGDFTVSSKLDGSLIICFLYEEELEFSSSGSFTSEHSQMARTLFYKQFSKSQQDFLIVLAKENTILFELIGPDNVIVVPYQENKLVVHGLINKTTYEMTPPLITQKMMKEQNIETAEIYTNMTVDALLKQVIEAKDIEGFVIRFNTTGKMLKIKVNDYLEKHHTFSIFKRSFYNKKSLMVVWSSILNSTFDDLLSASEQYISRKDELVAIFNNYLKLETQAKHHKHQWDTNNYNGKQIGLDPSLSKEDKGFIFACKNKQEIPNESCITEKHILKLLINIFDKNNTETEEED